jgi:hypothetical protein
LNNDWRPILDAQQETLGPEWKACVCHVHPNPDRAWLRAERQRRNVPNPKLDESEIGKFLSIEDPLIRREVLQERIRFHFNPERLHLERVANTSRFLKQNGQSGVLASFWMARERLKRARHVTSRHDDAARIDDESGSDDLRDTLVWPESESGRYGKRSERNNAALYDGGGFS